MKPYGHLMIEHRLIEKMLSFINRKKEKISDPNYDPLILDIIIDFMKFYADKTHHGKEDDILFAELATKKLEPEYGSLLKNLGEEHILSRNNMRLLVENNEKFKNKDTSVIGDIKNTLDWIVDFYPKHIKKEETILFPKVEHYFSADELEEMLINFWEFDRKMIHEKYKSVIENLPV